MRRPDVAIMTSLAMALLLCLSRLADTYATFIR